MTVTVEMYGLPPVLTRQRQAEIDLKEENDLPALVAGLRRSIPALSGSVINPSQDRLSENYAFIINGQFQQNDSHVRLKPGDRIVLVLLATGG
jgi:hypothetical protein